MQVLLSENSHAALAAQAAELPALRELMRGGSKTFFAASLLLPVRVRAPATALYAYCRLADDAIDLGVDPHAEMTRLKQRLDAIYQGRPSLQDADLALCQVVHRFVVPRELLDGLLEGFYWDVQGRHYETLEHVQDYGARVAGTVGAMMSLVMGVRSPEALARACELGVAMQLTNIARDVGEDARNGRLYLPRQWLREEGLDIAAWMQAPVFNPAMPEEAKVLARAKLTERLAWVDTQLEGKPFLMGDTFTVADAYLFTVAGWGKLVGVDITPMKNLPAYMGRVAARPAVQAAMKAEGLLK